MNIDKILIDLEIIGQLQENDKLAISSVPGSTKIFVDSYTMFGSIKRTYKGYNRDVCISYIEDLQKKIDESAGNIINGSHLDMCITLKASIEHAVVGLNNLKTTYSADSEIVAKLLILINKIQKSLDALNELNNTVDYFITNNEAGSRNGPDSYNAITTVNNSENNSENNSANNS